jgi:hypothetical protein
LRCFDNSTNGQSLGSTRIVDEPTRIVEERV